MLCLMNVGAQPLFLLTPNHTAHTDTTQFVMSLGIILGNAKCFTNLVKSP